MLLKIYIALLILGAILGWITRRLFGSFTAGFLTIALVSTIAVFLPILFIPLCIVSVVMILRG